MNREKILMGREKDLMHHKHENCQVNLRLRIVRLKKIKTSSCHAACKSWFRHFISFLISILGQAPKLFFIFIYITSKSDSFDVQSICINIDGQQYSYLSAFYPIKSFPFPFQFFYVEVFFLSPQESDKLLSNFNYLFFPLGIFFKKGIAFFAGYDSIHHKSSNSMTSASSYVG